MRSKKITENKPYKLEVRLSENLLYFVESQSKSFGMSKSDYIRMLLSSALAKCNRKDIENNENKA